MRGGLAIILGCALVVAMACAPAAPASPQAGAPGQGASAGGTGAAPAARPTTALEIAAYQGPDRQQLLEEGARREGKVVWYTTLAGGVVKALQEAFEQQYPYLKVDVFRAASQEVLAKVSEELQARRHTFDVLEMTPPGLMLLRDNKALAPYYSPAVTNVSEEVVEPAGNGRVHWAYDRASYIVFGYNTNLLPAEAVPRTYRDLLNPALRGKMAIPGTDTGVRTLGNMLTHQGEEFVQQFARQDVAVQMVSGRAVMDLVTSGEVPASPAIFRDHARVDIAKGAPVQWVALEPATMNTGGSAVSANAPHPHGAMLWVDFILGEAGRQVLAEFYYDTPAIDPGFRRWAPERGLSTDEVERKLDQWEDLLKRQFLRR